MTLLITYLGHLSHHLKVNLAQEPKEITVSLVSDSIILGKVAVTAARPEVRHIITGGITTVKIEELKRPSFFKRVFNHVGGWFR